MYVKVYIQNKPTSEGILAQGVELPEIIIESKTELLDELDSAVDFYFESLPEEKKRFLLEGSETFEELEKII